MDSNVLEQEKTEKPTPFLKRVSDLEKRVEYLEGKLKTVLKAITYRG